MIHGRLTLFTSNHCYVAAKCIFLACVLLDSEMGIVTLEMLGMVK